MIEISPKKIIGQWNDGYALDFHTITSEYIGDNEYGHPQFSSKYTGIGELLYRFDDLYRSGATMNAASSMLEDSGKAARVFALTLTRTQRHR